MNSYIEKGKVYSEDELAKLGCKKNDHCIGKCQTWEFIVDNHIAWLFRNCSTGTIEEIVVNYN